ncbi:transposase (plasmid) [Halobacterium salinarum]|uniref:transposase n=1 Tax=Halobacterium salinarum TaxID=2242 RepID=UPI0030D38D31
MTNPTDTDTSNLGGQHHTGSARIIAELHRQTDDLCHIHGHITRVISNLEIDADWFAGYNDPERAKFDLTGVVQLFLYQHARDFDQSTVARRLRGATYVYTRLGLTRPLNQQIINYSWRNRFDADERSTLKDAAECISTVCANHDVRGSGEPAPEPEDIQDTDIEEQQIMQAVERATDLGFDEFRDPRAANKSYALQAFFERQGYLNMAKAGTTTKRRRFARLSDRNEVPHGSTHNRTMKKVAAPTPQTALWDFTTGQPPAWQRIRDTVLPAFHAGVEKQLDEIAGRDRQGIRQPVHAAIDITTINFWPSPIKSTADIDPDEAPVENETGEFYPKEEFPAMVSGFKKQNKKKTERGYKFATITIIAEDTPIVLGIEPVRDYSWWERSDREDVATTSRAGVVARLLDQAEQHVDVHKLFCDSEFDIHGLRDGVDDRTIQYVIGKQETSGADTENIEEIIEDPVYDTRVEHAWQQYDGRQHKVSIIYLPGGEYSQFIVNGWVDADRAAALTTQYRKRWQIENQYKSIKTNFLPQTATTDYRVRFLYFVIGVMMYNVWRLANFLLRDEIDVDLGEDPVLLAGEIVELVGLCLFDPGG